MEGGAASRSRRASIAALTCMLCLVVLGGAASAQTTSTTVPGTRACTAKTLNVLFWPTGHPALPGVKFQNFPVPHTEVYLGSTTAYPDADFLAYFDVRGGRNFAPSCPTSTLPAKVKTLPAKSLATTTATTVLACRFKRPALLDVSPVPGSSDFQLRVIVDKTVQIFDRLGATTSSLSYAKQPCKLASPLT